MEFRPDQAIEREQIVLHAESIRKLKLKERTRFNWDNELNMDLDGCNIRISPDAIETVCGSTISLSWKEDFLNEYVHVGPVPHATLILHMGFGQLIYVILHPLTDDWIHEDYSDSDSEDDGPDLRTYYNHPNLKELIIKELRSYNLDFKISEKPSIFTTKFGKIIPTTLIVDILHRLRVKYVYFKGYGMKMPIRFLNSSCYMKLAESGRWDPTNTWDLAMINDSFHNIPMYFVTDIGEDSNGYHRRHSTSSTIFCSCADGL